MKGAISCRDCKHVVDIQEELDRHCMLRRWGKLIYSIRNFINHADIPIPNTLFECGLKAGGSVDPRYTCIESGSAPWWAHTLIIRMDYRHLNGKKGVGFCPFYKEKGWWYYFWKGITELRNKRLKEQEKYFKGTNCPGPS